MTISLYDQSVGVFRRGVLAVRGILMIGQKFAAENGGDEAALLNAALAPDMLPFVKQVQLVSDSAKAGAYRLAGLEPPAMEDSETSFPELIARLDATIVVLDRLERGQIDGREDAPVQFSIRDRAFDFTGATYLSTFAMPNFYFHYVTAYAVLRHKGVPLGKRDFLGKL